MKGAKMMGKNDVTNSTLRASPKYFDTYAFRLGDFQLISVLDGMLTADCATILNGPPPKLLAGLLGSCNLTVNSTIRIPWTMLFIDTGKNKVLVDTGMSKIFVDVDPVPAAEGGQTIPGQRPGRAFISGHPVDCGHLLENLRYMDIKAAEIDTVIITHAHPDHIGGLVDPGSDRPTFPNARVVMWKEEWQFYMENPDALSRLGTLARGPVPESVQLKYARQCLEPIKEQLTLIDSEQTDIVPGIRYLNAHGHSFMMGVVVSSGKEQLLDIADAVIHPIQLERPEWLYTSDLDREQAAASRRRLCEWAIAGNTLVASPHFPFPGLGRIERKGRGYRWQPVVI
jgi:glyoxylase-like metal-dependent hydrolase (beta-lactamase superfamily II)